jgi:hypothetical protein
VSAVLKQLEELKEAVKNTAQWEDMISVEEIARKTGGKSIQVVKDILNEKGLKHVAKIGKTYLYSKAELLKVFKEAV